MAMNYSHAQVPAKWVIPPLHAIIPVGDSLAHDYFSPGSYKFNGKTIGSLWAIAYYNGESYRFERAQLGEPWVRVA